MLFIVKGAGAPVLCCPVSAPLEGQTLAGKFFSFFCSVHRIAWRDDTILFRKVTIQLPQVAIYILVSIFMSLWSLQIERGVEARNSGSRRPFLYIRKMQSMMNSNHTVRHIGLISPDF